MGRKLKLCAAAVVCAACGGWLLFRTSSAGATRINQTFSAPFERKILETPPEAPFQLRFFTTAVKSVDGGRACLSELLSPQKRSLRAN